MTKIIVKDTEINVSSINENDYISLTDIARYNSDEPTSVVIGNWMRNCNTIEYLGRWERINNFDFKDEEFEAFCKQSASQNTFNLSPEKWINATNAIGIVIKSEINGICTYAYKNIAFNFARWISLEFELCMVKEFQNLKERELLEEGWKARHGLSTIDFLTDDDYFDSVKHDIIPNELTPE